jgi:hypothetical protein
VGYRVETQTLAQFLWEAERAAAGLQSLDRLVGAELAQAFRGMSEMQTDRADWAVQEQCRVFQRHLFRAEVAVRAAKRAQTRQVKADTQDRTDLCGLVGFRFKPSPFSCVAVLTPFCFPFCATQLIPISFSTSLV